MNPTFTVSIDTEKRKASAVGLVAVGEKVDVVVTGLDVTQIPAWEQDNDEGFTGPSLRFRLVSPDGKDLVRFPLAEGDAWTVNEDGSLSAEVDFNTMPLRHWFHGYEIGAKAEVGMILDSVVDAMEYGRGTVKILQWTASPAEDPTILPDWRKTLRDLNAAIVEIKDSVDLAEGYANDAEASAGVATEKAGVAETAANNALSSKSAAEGFKDAAQTAAGTATAKAEEAAASADTATTKAEEAADSAGDAAQILEDIEETIASKAEQSDLEAEVERATQKEEELENGLTEANDAISDNADAIDQLEESKADKTALDTLSDAIDSEAETREEKDAAICAKLNQEIGNRQSAIHNLNFAIQQEAYRAQVVEAGLVSMVSEKADKSDTYTKTEVDTKIAGVQTFQKYLVNELPDADEADMKGLYLVPTGETSEEGDLCEEWTVVEEDGEKRWEKIGGTTVDLDNYYTKSEVNGKLDEKQAKLYTQGQPGWTFSTESTGSEIEAFMADAANYSVTEEQAGSAWLYTLTGYDEENYYVAPVGRTAQSTSIPFYVFDVTQTSMYGSVLAEYSSTQSDVPAQVDTTPTANSGRLVTSGGVWSAIWGALSALPAGFSSLYDWCVSQLAGKATKADATLNERGYTAWELSEHTEDSGPIVIRADGSAWYPCLLRVCGAFKSIDSSTTSMTWTAYEWEGDYQITAERANASSTWVIITPQALQDGYEIYSSDGSGPIMPVHPENYGNVKGNTQSTSLTWRGSDSGNPEWPGTTDLTATRTALQGYQLGSQDDKPLASEAEAEALRQGKQNALTAQQLANIAAVSDALAFDVTHTYAAGDPVVYNGTLYTFTAAHTDAWTGSDVSEVDIIARLAGKLDSTSAAPAFSTSSTYAVGDHVTYNGALYRCTTAVTTAGAWTGSTNWTADTMTDTIRYDRVTITTSQLQDHAEQKVTLNAATTTLTLPALTTGKVSDFGIDVVNGYEVSGTPTAASFTLDGTLGSDYNLIVPKGEDWSEMSALAAGEMAVYYFTLSAFQINDKPTWEVMKKVVELVPVPSAP